MDGAAHNNDDIALCSRRNARLTHFRECSTRIYIIIRLIRDALIRYLLLLGTDSDRVHINYTRRATAASTSGVY